MPVVQLAEQEQEVRLHGCLLAFLRRRFCAQDCTEHAHMHAVKTCVGVFVCGIATNGAFHVAAPFDALGALKPFSAAACEPLHAAILGGTGTGIDTCSPRAHQGSVRVCASASIQVRLVALPSDA